MKESLTFVLVKLSCKKILICFLVLDLSDKSLSDLTLIIETLLPLQSSDVIA